MIAGSGVLRVVAGRDAFDAPAGEERFLDELIECLNVAQHPNAELLGVSSIKANVVAPARSVIRCSTTYSSTA